MAKQVQFRRGTTAQLSSVTGVEGELFVDTTKDTLTVHDGYQAGGFPLLREDLNNLANNTINISKLQHGSATAGQTIVVNSAANGLEYGSGFSALSDVGLLFDTAGGHGPYGPSATHISERYGAIPAYSLLNVTTTAQGNQKITIPESGTYFIKCCGASGGGKGGQGGTSWGTITLSAGDILFIRIGQMGNVAQQIGSTTLTDPEDSYFSNNITATNNYGDGGYGDGHGGDGAAPNSGNTAGGGGATAVRLNTDSTANRIIVAGGGGGGYIESSRYPASNSAGYTGGNGGGKIGEQGEQCESSGQMPTGGTQSAGGAAGSGGNSGTQTAGGSGGSNDGGGGGGGYWGGGGGTNAPAAGGSGYVGGMNAANRGMAVGGNMGHGWLFIQKVA